MLRPKGITRRITLLAWSVTLGTLAIFVSIILPGQKRDLRVQLQSKAAGVAAALHGEIASAAITEDYSSVVDHAMQVLAGDPAVDFLVIARNDGFALIIQRDNWRMEPDIGPLWRPRNRTSSGTIGVVPLFNQRLFHYSAPFDYNGIEWGWIHVGLSLDSYDQASREVNARTAILTIACVLLALVASVVYAGYFVRPVHRLQEVVERVAGGDLTARAEIRSHDEIERLADAFNSMADAILHRDRALSDAKSDLEIRVIQRTQELREQILARDRAHAELAEAQQRLIELSRLSGMAEVATGVLHNVGNVLNSVNVSATLAADKLKKSKIANLSRVVTMFNEHSSDLATFLTHDPKGKLVPGYLTQFAEHMAGEHAAAITELESLCSHVEHIKDIVSMQQSYARVSGISEIVNVTDLVEDSLRLNAGALARHEVELVRDFQPVPQIAVEKHKVLQILVNLLRNAKYACDESGRKDKRVTLRIANGDGTIKISVMDNGVGIPSENLTRIFNHGFTTRRNGHGFGLHSGALAARELGGRLLVESDGPGKGATFTLELPAGEKT